MHANTGVKFVYSQWIIILCITQASPVTALEEDGQIVLGVYTAAIALCICMVFLRMCLDSSSCHCHTDSCIHGRTVEDLSASLVYRDFMYGHPSFTGTIVCEREKTGQTSPDPSYDHTHKPFHHLCPGFLFTHGSLQPCITQRPETVCIERSAHQDKPKRDTGNTMKYGHSGKALRLGRHRKGNKSNRCCSRKRTVEKYTGIKKMKGRRLKTNERRIHGNVCDIKTGPRKALELQDTSIEFIEKKDRGHLETQSKYGGNTKSRAEKLQLLRQRKLMKKRSSLTRMPISLQTGIGASE